MDVCVCVCVNAFPTPLTLNLLWFTNGTHSDMPQSTSVQCTLYIHHIIKTMWPVVYDFDAYPIKSLSLGPVS